MVVPVPTRSSDGANPASEMVTAGGWLGAAAGCDGSVGVVRAIRETTACMVAVGSGVAIWPAAVGADDAVDGGACVASAPVASVAGASGGRNDERNASTSSTRIATPKPARTTQITASGPQP